MLGQLAFLALLLPHIHRSKQVFDFLNLKVVTKSHDAGPAWQCGKFATRWTWNVAGHSSALLLVRALIIDETVGAERVSASQHLRIAERFKTDHAVKQLLKLPNHMTRRCRCVRNSGTAVLFAVR